MALLCIAFSLSYGGDGNPIHHWTWTYSKYFSESLSIANTYKKIISFTQENVPPFTQLIFSWNAFRPKKDYFSFYVQVRDAITKKWGSWHHMVDWGDNMQQSYFSKSDGFSSYFHVRLEIDDKKVSDAFRIKVESQKSVSLSLIRNFTVTISDFNNFKPEIYDNVLFKNLPSIHILNVPEVAQFALDHVDKSRICSPVSCSMVTNYITKKRLDPLDFAAGVFDKGLDIYGSWGCNTAHAFEQVGGKMCFFVKRMNSFLDLHAYLLKGIPIIVSVRGNLPGALKSFPHGHLLVVVGWDQRTQELLCHDPAANNDDMVFKRYPLVYFLRAWESSHRLAYIAEAVSRE